MANTRQSLKVWSLAESVIITSIITGTRQATAVSGVTILESENCGAFFVYELQNPPHCYLRYCGNGTAGKLSCLNV